LITNTHKGARAIHARNHADTGAVASPIKIPLSKGNKKDSLGRRLPIKVKLGNKVFKGDRMGKFEFAVLNAV
jgi:hypothetical protein